MVNYKFFHMHTYKKDNNNNNNSEFIFMHGIKLKHGNINCCYNNIINTIIDDNANAPGIYLFIRKNK